MTSPEWVDFTGTRMCPGDKITAKSNPNTVCIVMSLLIAESACSVLTPAGHAAVVRFEDIDSIQKGNRQPQKEIKSMSTQNTGKYDYVVATSDPACILNEASKAIENRAKERDVNKERSMANAVKAFNAMFDADMTEVQGWQFMALLKMSRSKHTFNLDDYVDLCGYAALAGECAGQQSGDGDGSI